MHVWLVCCLFAESTKQIMFNIDGGKHNCSLCRPCALMLSWSDTKCRHKYTTRYTCDWASLKRLRRPSRPSADWCFTNWIGRVAILMERVQSLQWPTTAEYPQIISIHLPQTLNPKSDGMRWLTVWSSIIFWLYLCSITFLCLAGRLNHLCHARLRNCSFSLVTVHCCLQRPKALPSLSHEISIHGRKTYYCKSMCFN